MTKTAPYDSPKYLAVWERGIDGNVLFYNDLDLDEFIAELDPESESDDPTLIYEFSSHTWSTVEWPEPRMVKVS